MESPIDISYLSSGIYLIFVEMGDGRFLKKNHKAVKKNQNYFILNYSAFAIVYLLCKNVEAEAIYTEIDPDIILSEDGDAYNLDMNNDGLLDFKLQKISGSFYSYWSENISYAYYIAISPWQSGNKMAGLKV